MLRKVALGLVALLTLAAVLFFGVVPGVVDRSANKLAASGPYAVGDAARRLHAQLFVADMHADPLLWKRDLLVEASHGHVDLPRLRRGGVALQVFTTVTKVPAGQNYEGNASDSDLLGALAISQLWPARTWTSLTERALYQATKLFDVAARSNGGFVVVRNRPELEQFLERRTKQPELTAGVLGVEGLHALEGQFANLDRLYEAGFRVMGLEHFFDNEVGGSAHGAAKGGITDFGRQVVRRIEERGMLIDLAHSSPRLMDDVLAMVTRPVIVSHGGVKGTCDNIRNLDDDHLRRVAATGGVVGIGYWDAAVCDPTVAGIVRAIQYGIRVAGADHIGLGSDFDGATTTPFDTSGVPLITEGLLKAGVSPDDIRKVMGGNVLRVLREILPAS